MLRLEKTKELVNKWFAPIPAGPKNNNSYPTEPEQTEMRRISTVEDVPKDSIYMCFKMCNRLDKDYYATDVLSDLLGQSESSFLNEELVKKNSVFTKISAFVLGSTDEGLIVVNGMPSKGVTLEQAEQKVWEKIEEFKNNYLNQERLNRAINKVKTVQGFSLLETLEKAMSLSFSENYGDIEMTNNTMQKYEDVNLNQIKSLANNLFRKEKSTVLHYIAKKK